MKSCPYNKLKDEADKLILIAKDLTVKVVYKVCRTGLQQRELAAEQSKTRKPIDTPTGYRVEDVS